VTRDEYLRRVGFSLSDLPWGMRRDLLAELRGHLDELPPGTDLRTQLGPPEEYAADLRSAAGLERRRGPIAFLRARRLRYVILTVIGLMLIGLAIGAVVWIDSYQPLAFGDGYQYPAGARGVPGVSGSSVVFRKGRPFTFGIQITNNGRYTVRILGVPYEPIHPWTAHLLMTRPNYSGSVTPYERFRPFDLKPRQIVFLIYKGVYACHTGMGAGGILTYSDFPVRYKFLWRTATTAIPLPENLAFVFRKSCPPLARSSATP
jgi:hypothetical protein